MSDIDVKQLAAESLESGAFPVSLAADFRVSIDSSVYDAIHAHAGEDTSVEVCGILVGEWRKDADGPFAVVKDFIRCDEASSKNAEVTFTHESWAHINKEMDSRFSDQRIVGWYHTHPDFGIFLSDRDMFIQEHFFSGPGQIAYVVDPVRKVEGIFEWRGGKAELIERYWVGNRIIPVTASQSSPAARSMAKGTEPPQSVDSRSSVSSTSAWTATSLLLSALCVFLLGFLFSSWNSRWEEKYMLEGAIAHYGVWNVMQVGRSEQIEDVRQRVELMAVAASDLSKRHTALTKGDDKKQVQQEWEEFRKQLTQTHRQIKTIESLYSIPVEQRDLLMAVVNDQLARLRLKGFNGPTFPVPVPAQFVDGPPDVSSEKAATPDAKSTETTDSTQNKTASVRGQGDEQPRSTPAVKPDIGPKGPPSSPQ